MIEEKWQETLNFIRNTFEVEEEFDGEIEDIPGATFKGIVFFTSKGKFKIVRSRHPRVLDKKTQFSGRGGSAVGVEYEYSKTDFVDDLEISQWSDLAQDWQRASMDSILS